MSHLAQESRAPSSAGNERAAIRWWNAFTDVGATVLKGGTMVQSPGWCFGRGEMTTTGRFVVISGRLNPLKSHIHNVPGFGWYGSAIERC